MAHRAMPGTTTLSAYRRAAGAKTSWRGAISGFQLLEEATPLSTMAKGRPTTTL